VLGLIILSTTQVSAQPLTMDTPTGNLTGEIDISIDPAEPLPANGTSTISTEGAIDTDLNGFPPEGVYVIISSDTVTVTNQTVDIGTADEEEQESEPLVEPQQVTEPEGGSEEESEPEGGSEEEEGEEEEGEEG
ncbi:MAG: hypothetical protein ACRD47_15555, partial [Nitrososphaeraceae archaeon]